MIITHTFILYHFYSHDYVKMYLGESKVEEALKYGKHDEHICSEVRILKEDLYFLTCRSFNWLVRFGTLNNFTR